MVMRGELEVSEADRHPNIEPCRTEFSFEFEKADFLRLGMGTENLVPVERFEILGAVPVVSVMHHEPLASDSLIVMELASRSGVDKVVEAKFGREETQSVSRVNFQVLWSELAASLRAKIERIPLSPEVSVTSNGP